MNILELKLNLIKNVSAENLHVERQRANFSPKSIKSTSHNMCLICIYMYIQLTF